MLRLLSRNLKFRPGLAARCFSTSEKDYYAILGIPDSANDQEIKEAYREKAKQYHPDASLVGEDRKPDITKFREVAEAYAILSIRENRLNYDLTRKSSSHVLFDGEKVKEMEARRDERGLVRPDYKRGSYVEFRKRELRRERQLFNVDEFGRYRGGVPKKNNGRNRGSAQGDILRTRVAEEHNYDRFEHQDSTRVTPGGAFEHLMSQTQDAKHLRYERPWYPLLYDRDQRHWKDRHYYLQVLLLLFGSYYVFTKIDYEMQRWQKYDRDVNFPLGRLNSEYFVNRGGVVLKKEFLGFESLHKNNDDLMEWYKMAYPREFGMLKEEPKKKPAEDKTEAPATPEKEAKEGEGAADGQKKAQEGVSEEGQKADGAAEGEKKAENEKQEAK